MDKTLTNIHLRKKNKMSMFHQYQAYVPFYFNDNNNKSRKQLPGPFSLE